MLRVISFVRSCCYIFAVATVSWSESEYFARESDGTVTVQLVKDKRIARPLELVVTVLTVQEAEVFGCLSFNTTLMEAGILCRI